MPSSGHLISTPAVQSAHMAVELDALDVDLLAALRGHTRVGVLELSRTLRVARGTVQARLDRLERGGVLKGCGPEIDLDAAGYRVQAFVTLEIAQGALEDVTAERYSDYDALPRSWSSVASLRRNASSTCRSSAPSRRSSASRL